MTVQSPAGAHCGTWLSRREPLETGGRKGSEREVSLGLEGWDRGNRKWTVRR